jgi:hypothetical protein
LSPREWMQRDEILKLQVLQLKKVHGVDEAGPMSQLKRSLLTYLGGDYFNLTKSPRPLTPAGRERPAAGVDYS